MTPREPSELMAIVLAFKNGEADWPTTKEALVNFPYVPEEPTPRMGTPEYYDWYVRADNDSPPNTLGELTEAAYTSAFEYDRFEEVANALAEKYPQQKAKQG